MTWLSSSWNWQVFKLFIMGMEFIWKALEFVELYRYQIITLEHGRNLERKGLNDKICQLYFFFMRVVVEHILYIFTCNRHVIHWLILFNLLPVIISFRWYWFNNFNNKILLFVAKQLTFSVRNNVTEVLLFIESYWKRNFQSKCFMVNQNVWNYYYY